MKTKLLLVAVLLSVLTDSRAASFREKLQENIHLPSMTAHFSFSFSVHIYGGLDNFGQFDAQSAAQKLAEAEALAAQEVTQQNSAEYYLALGKAWQQADNQEKAERAFRKVLELLPKTGTTNDADQEHRKLMEIEAVFGVGDINTAWKLSKVLVKSSPKSAMAWFDLGINNLRLARDMVLPGKDKADLGEIVAATLKGGERQLDVKLCREYLEEAEADFSRCIELAPALIGPPYMNRMCSTAMLEALKRRETGATDNFQLMPFLMKGQKAWELKLLAAASSNNVGGLTWVAMFSLGNGLLKEGVPDRGDANGFAEVDRVVVERLEHFLNSGTPEQAELAGQILLILYTSREQYAKDLECSKRLMVVAPKNETYWQGYLKSLDRMGRYEQLVKEAKERMRARPDAWTCLEMAMAYEKLGQPEGVDEVLRLATKLKPDWQMTKFYAILWVVKHEKLTDESISNYSAIAARLDHDETGEEEWESNIAYLRAACYALQEIYGMAGVQLDRADTARSGDENVTKLRELIKQK